MTFTANAKFTVTFSTGLSGELVMQGDGNFCWYVKTSSYAATWCSKTNGQPGDYADWQGDGNLVVYDHGVAKWASRTNGRGEYLALQADGNLIVYGFPAGSLEEGPIWAAF